ncbi:MAG: hydrogenase 2 operon protein HybA [Deltaproteobacteria bacterium]|nr:hydrogenase 2 operon protein HybA [Deltaproteobacteria bacterium]
MNISRRSLLKGVLASGVVAMRPGQAQAREKRQPHPEAVGVLYDSTRCVGCGGCVVACKEANGLPWDAPKELSSTTKSVLKKKKVVAPGGEEATAFVRQQCMHCVDPSCVSACMLGALHKEGEGKRDLGGERQGTGIVLYDKSLCVGCRYCQIACAFAIPRFEWTSAAPGIVKCELCRQHAQPEAQGPLAQANPGCCQVCPAEALSYGRRTDLIVEARRRIAEDPQGYNPRVFGEVDGGGTQVLMLAGAGVSFQQLGLPKLPDHSSAYQSERAVHAPYLSGATPIALYATAAFIIRRNAPKSDEADVKGGAR